MLVLYMPYHILFPWPGFRWWGLVVVAPEVYLVTVLVIGIVLYRGARGWPVGTAQYHTAFGGGNINCENVERASEV